MALHVISRCKLKRTWNSLSLAKSNIIDSNYRLLLKSNSHQPLSSSWWTDILEVECVNALAFLPACYFEAEEFQSNLYVYIFHVTGIAWEVGKVWGKSFIYFCILDRLCMCVHLCLRVTKKELLYAPCQSICKLPRNIFVFIQHHFDRTFVY